jgi:hypothetical protein
MKFALTGTHVYGPVGPDSDLDIVVMQEGAADILDFLRVRGIEMYRTPGQDEYGDDGGFYFDLAGIKINIIIAADTFEFVEWKRRTERMKYIPPIENREERLATFREEEVKS